jgi:hypothetical protein
MGSTSILEILQWQVWSTLALAVATMAMLAFFQNVWVAVTKHWWMPRRLRRIMEQQGWKGPPFRFLVGSVPEVLEFLNEQVSRLLAIRDFDTLPRISPQYALFSRKYGTFSIQNRLYSHTILQQIHNLSTQNVNHENNVPVQLHTIVNITWH